MRDGGIMIVIPVNESNYAAQTVAYTGTAGSVTGWTAGSSGLAVLVWCDTAAYIKVGNAVTATTSDTPLPANTPCILAIPPNAASFRVSAIQIATGGKLYAKPVAAIQ